MVSDSSSGSGDDAAGTVGSAEVRDARRRIRHG